MIKYLEDYLPFFKKLSKEEKEKILVGCRMLSCKEGESLRSKNDDCLGFVLVISGRLRVYITSDEGKEITLYRLLERDACLFAASCAMSNIQFDVMLAAEEDTRVLIISPCVYKGLSDTSLPVAVYTNELMSSRLSDVMWLMDQVLNKRLDSRLAALLIEESNLRESDTIPRTQEQIANHLGTAREVVTRMLRSFQAKGMVSLKRGVVELLNKDKLDEISDSSQR